jgi:hypothetical protein
MLRRRKSQFPPPTKKTDYPTGTFVETEKGFFYIVNKAKRYRLISRRVLDSWSPQRVVKTTEAAVAHYRVAAKMKFRNGSLIWNISDGKVYLIEEGKRRWVVSPEVYYRLGLNPSLRMKDIIWVSMDEVNLHQLGEDLH